MGFLYNCFGESAKILFSSDDNKEFDFDVWEKIKAFTDNQNLLPITKKEVSGVYTFSYDITPCTNLVAWMNEANKEEKAFMQKKIVSTVSMLVKSGISREKLVLKTEYMYVNDYSGEIQLICIPLKDKKEKSAVSFPPAGQGEGGLEIRPISAAVTERDGMGDSLGEDKTMMFVSQDDDSPTILLTPVIHAKLLRISTQQSYDITSAFCRIGKKKSDVDVWIDDNPTISREHCRITYENGKFYLEDSNSLNFTYLEEKRVMPGKRVELIDGSRLTLSDETFLFRICAEDFFKS